MKKRFGNHLFLAVIMLLVLTIGLATCASADNAFSKAFGNVGVKLGSNHDAANVELAKPLFVKGALSMAVDAGYAKGINQFNQNTEGSDYYGELGLYYTPVDMKKLKAKIGVGPGVYRTFERGGPVNNGGAFGTAEVDVGNVYLQYKFTTVHNENNDGLWYIGVKLL